MKRLLQLAVLATLIGGGVPGAQAQGLATGTFSNTPNAGSGLVGYHVNGPSVDPGNYPHGFSLDVDATPW